MDLIAVGDAPAALDLAAAIPGLAGAALRLGATRLSAEDNFLTAIRHYVYAGDTALHVAAAAHQPEIARGLIGLGAHVAATNRRGATPLHYAADGSPGSDRWNPDGQTEAIGCLIEAGADPNAADRDGVTPLHRAVRTRCAAAVAALVARGADPMHPNGNGSTALMLATRTTGRSGSGSAEAKAEQAEILRLFQRFG
jgi:hypothetical protein